jgi:hypothetical protein
MTNDSALEEVAKNSLESLKLRPGSLMQIHHAAQSAPICEVKLLGVVRGKGVMIGLKGESGVKTKLETGKDYIIRGFTGQHDYSFSSRVTQIFQEPIAYAILGYPSEVEASAIRKAIRSKISVPATASLQDKNIPMAVTLIDLNMGGAKLDSPVRLGPPGELLNLAFAVDFEKNKMDMALLSTIRYTVKAETGDGYSIGVEFKDLNRDNKLILHYVASQENMTGNRDVVL